jgi:hypothetical protein
MSNLSIISLNNSPCTLTKWASKEGNLRLCLPIKIGPSSNNAKLKFQAKLKRFATWKDMLYKHNS